jgi:hypothetical protein
MRWSRPLAAKAAWIPLSAPVSIDAAAAERREEGRVTGGVGVVTGWTSDRLERREPVGLGSGGETRASAGGETRVLIGGTISLLVSVAGAAPRLDLRRAPDREEVAGAGAGAGAETGAGAGAGTGVGSETTANGSSTTASSLFLFREDRLAAGVT